MADVQTLVDDLCDEGNDLDELVAHLSETDWRRITPAAGWTVAHQVAHLNWTDEVAALAARGSREFDAVLDVAVADPERFVDDAADHRATTPPAELLTRWRTGRADLADALLQVPAGTKIAWFGPPMSAASMATARIMETWAHGRDVSDALGIARTPTNRLRHIAHIGVRTRDFAYILRDRTPPAAPFRVHLVGPQGDEWTWGPEDAAQHVTGSAEDFCLLVTQRAHRDDLDVVATGDDAAYWLTIAQAFAGAPGSGRTTNPGRGERS